LEPVVRPPGEAKAPTKLLLASPCLDEAPRCWVSIDAANCYPDRFLVVTRRIDGGRKK